MNSGIDLRYIEFCDASAPGVVDAVFTSIVRGFAKTLDSMDLYAD